jgi:phage tail-like protein
VRSINPVVGETNDGTLNAIRARPVTPEMVHAALTGAAPGPVAAGSGGAGAGAVAVGWKGGIGTASRRLPRTLSRDPGAADFLHRYLSGMEGVLAELEARAALRHVLLDPCATPEDALPWLASFVGLLLDERWSVRAKRTAVAEAAWLFRYRGTVAGLRRFLEIGLESRVVLIEHFKLRGQGAGLLGGAGPEFTSSVLGGGFRVGVSKLLVQRALATHAGIDAKRVAQRMMGYTDGKTVPTPERYQALIALAGDPATEQRDEGQPYPFFLAHQLDLPPELFSARLGPVSDWLVEWKYDGIRGQVVRRNGKAWIWSAWSRVMTLCISA